MEVYIFRGYPYTNNLTPIDSVFGHPAIPQAIAVGAINMSAQNVIADYSSQGPVTIRNYGTRAKPEICGAAGVSISGAGGFQNPFYGTSAAAPHVAAIAALLWSKNMTLTNTEIRQALLANANDMGAAGFDNIYGYGKADALAAFNSIPSNDKITSFSVAGQQGSSVIDATNHTVTFIMPYGSNVTAISPTIIVSPGATINPPSGTSCNFTSPVTYTVTAQNAVQQEWTVNCVFVIKPVKSLKASSSSVKLSPGSSQAVTIKAKYTDNTENLNVNNSFLTWSSDNTSIATADDGFITFAGFGTAKITASITFNGKVVSTNIKVDTRLKKLIPDKKALSIPPGEFREIKLTATYADGTVDDLVSSKADWSKPDDCIFITSVENGVISVHNTIGGKASVTATYGGKSVKITVSNMIKKLTSNNKKIYKMRGDFEPIIIYADYGDGVLVDVTDLVEDWTIDQTSVFASFDTDDEGQRIVLASNDMFGKAKITAKYLGKSVTIQFSNELKRLKAVTKIDNVPIKKMTMVTDTSLSITDLVSVKATWADGSSIDDVTPNIVWGLSSKPLIATIDEAGNIVSLMTKGTTSITGTFGGKTVKITLNVILPSVD